jgi:hypothetical protein
MIAAMVRTMVLVALVVAGVASAAYAQPAAGSDAGSAAAPAAPVSPARAACVAAMNADPKFAAELVKAADERAAAERANETIQAHQDAVAHIEKNEKHVIYAYAAMWIIAAAFVVFLWRRQQVLTAEIATLRRDLEAAAGDAPGAGGKERA